MDHDRIDKFEDIARRNGINYAVKILYEWVKCGIIDLKTFRGCINTARLQYGKFT